MKFSIVIYAAPYSSEAAFSAFRFVSAVIEQGHEIHRLFFMGDGVLNASRLSVTPQDEKNLQQNWDELIRKNSLDSVLCVSSAIKRGIVDAGESKRYELDGVSAFESSEIAGLGQLVDASVVSDRVVSFG
jgi:tRNA 2-thiouridine synthesizing protein D